MENKKLLNTLRKAEDYLLKASDLVRELRDEVEMPLMIEEIRAKKGFKISTESLQRHFDIGYGRAARLVDLLKVNRSLKG